MTPSTAALIIDSGPFSCKVGWSFNEVPTSEMGHISTLSFQPSQQSTPSRINPLDMTDVESLWYTAVQDYDRWLHDTESPVLLFDSRIQREDRTSMAEFFFEVLDVPSLHFPSEGLILTAALKRLQFNSVSHNPQPKPSPSPPTTINDNSTSIQLATPFTGVIINTGYESTRLFSCLSGYTQPKPSPSPPTTINDNSTSIQLATPFTGVIINTGYESTRLFSCLSGYTPPEPSQLFPIGGRIATQIIFAHLHRTSPDQTLSTGTTPTNLPSSDHLCVNPSMQQLHHCCSKLCRVLFEKRCFVSTDPFTDLLEIQGFGSTSRRSSLQLLTTTPSLSLSPVQQLASILPFWHCCPLKARRSRPSHASQFSASYGSDDGNRSLVGSHEQHFKPDGRQPSQSPQSGLTGIGRHASSRESTSTGSASTNRPLRESDLQEHCQSMNFQEYQCCICSSIAFDKANPPMQLKQHRHQDVYQRIHDRRSKYPRYLNLLGDPIEMMTRQHFQQLLHRHPLIDQTVQRLIGESMFMAPEIFFSPAYVSQNLGSSNIEDLQYLEKRKGLADSIVSIFNQTPIDCKRQMYSNIVLLGGICGLPCFDKRVLQEIKKALEHHFHSISSSSTLSLDRICLRVLTPQTPEEQRFATWIGLRELWLNHEELNQFSITKAEFEERGVF